MIKERPLGRKAARYAEGVVSALSGGSDVARWNTVKGLIEAAYFNGFQSGIVWQKRYLEQEGDRPFRIEVESIDIGLGKVANMEKAVTDDGDFIGSPKEATVLWKKFGITQFELRTKKSKVCTVGYSPTQALWYGWSHRAIRGFKTRKEAARFAESVS